MISSPIDEIKNRLDVVEVVGSYLKLQKAGANFRALCPFHSEKKPSLFISPARQIWHCFGCSKGGDIFGFIREIEGVEFGDALRILAQKAGVQLKRQDPVLITERKLLYEIGELASRFFEKQLEESVAGKEAKKYLLDRGITDESFKKWRVGYAPNTWHGLTDFLESRGYKKEEIKKAGVGILTDDGNFYDRFRGRITFPILDANSQTVGFGGRYFENPLRVSKEDPEEMAKYINTPQTLLYDKSRVLYGLDKAKVEIRKKEFCILVEGYIDVIMSHQSGVENVAATSGTALTSFQLQVLKRYSDNLFTAFDMDIAGDSATKRGIDLAQGQGFNIKVITMPKEKDPADIVSQNPEDWLKLINEAKSILQFYFENAFVRFDAVTPEGKRNISKILLPVIKMIPNKIEQSHWIQELSRKLGVKEEVVEEELKKVKGQEFDVGGLIAESDVGSATVIPRKKLLEDTVASLVIKNPESTIGLITDEHLHLFSLPYQAIFTDLKQGKPVKEDDLTNYLYLKAEVEGDGVDPKAEVQICLKGIKSLEFKNTLDEISRDLKKAEEGQDAEKVNILTQKFKDTASELTNL